METHDQVLRIQALGPFRLWIGDVELTPDCWKSKKALMLLKCLVARMGERSPKDLLAEALWPDEEQVDADHRFYTTVYFLRRTLASKGGAYNREAYVGQANGLYWLDCRLAQADACEFVDLYEQGVAREDSAPEEALRLLESALQLYRGDFLAEDLYEEWTVAPREHYLEIYIDATLRASSLLIKVRQDYSGAVRCCKTALQKEPYREELHQAIIRHLIGAGRNGEAVMQYRQYAKMLQEEFGLAPSPSIRALFNSVSAKGRDIPDFLSHPENRGPDICDKQSFELLCRVTAQRQALAGEPLVLMQVATDIKRRNKCSQKQAIQYLRQSLGQGDVICSWDPDRILVLLGRVNEADAERLRRRMELGLQRALVYGAKVTYSLLPCAGVAEWPLTMQSV